MINKNKIQRKFRSSLCLPGSLRKSQEKTQTKQKTLNKNVLDQPCSSNQDQVFSCKTPNSSEIKPSNLFKIKTKDPKLKRVRSMFMRKNKKSQKERSSSLKVQNYNKIDNMTAADIEENNPKTSQIATKKSLPFRQ